MKMSNACSTTGCQAVEGVCEAYQSCGTSAVVTAQRGNKSQLLPSKRHMAAVDDTISRVGMHDMG